MAQSRSARAGGVQQPQKPNREGRRCRVLRKQDPKKGLDCRKGGFFAFARRNGAVSVANNAAHNLEFFSASCALF
jgi:hypothetical protein